MQTYDTIVIGGGGMGSAAAYHLAKAGARVLLLEQFQHGHKQGSSHGETRGIRLSYDKPFYTHMMQAAYAEWRALEMLVHQQLLFISGGITFAPPAHPKLTATWDSLQAAGVAAERWDAAQLARRFPQFNVPQDTAIIWQRESGLLHASACIAAHLQLAQQHGAEVRTDTPVTRLDWQDEQVSVHTEGEVLWADKVVVTAGAWTGQLLAELNLPLTVTRQQVVYYQPADPVKFSADNFPTLIELTQENEFYYGIPFFGNEGLKLARHGGGAQVTPDTCNRTPDEDYIERLDRRMRTLIPECGQIKRAEVCLYTETPDTDFIIDRHPHGPQVLLAAGFSGHGFKFCALVGRILSELALHGEASFDLNPFRIGRTHQ